MRDNGEDSTFGVVLGSDHNSRNIRITNGSTRNKDRLAQLSLTHTFGLLSTPQARCPHVSFVVSCHPQLRKLTVNKIVKVIDCDP